MENQEIYNNINLSSNITFVAVSILQKFFCLSVFNSTYSLNWNSASALQVPNDRDVEG